MASPLFNISAKPLGRIATFTPETAVGLKGETGSLANTVKPQAGGGQINVVKQFKWTLSDLTQQDEIPYIRLIEYKSNEDQIRKQMDLYSNLTPESILNFLGAGGEKKGVLDIYKDIFPKTNPTDFSYWFPYFNQTGFELRTQQWQSMDSIGDSLGKIASGASKIASIFGAKGQLISKGIDAAKAIGEAGAEVGSAALLGQYPSVGVMDRPKVFTGHESRQVTISFPLYNTVDEEDWGKNRDLIYLLMSQNLFNKRDYITGVPPVWYDIYVPGQYYCYAAAMTDIKVENLGNQRLLYNEFVVPDAYQVTLTLSEMVMPSKNQFEAITSGAARSFVDSSTLLKKEGTALETAGKIAGAVAGKIIGVIPGINSNTAATIGRNIGGAAGRAAESINPF